MALDPEERKAVITNFQNWLEIQERRKELTEENKDVVSATSSLLGQKATLVNKLFKIMKKKAEDGEDELEDLYNLLNDVEG
jgi:hypothetical protein